MYHVKLILGAAALLPWGSVVRDDRQSYAPGVWVWPVPRYRSAPSIAGYDPVASQEFHQPGHNGIDVMYRRVSKFDQPTFVAGTHDGSAAFFAPPGVMVCAAHDGLIWSCGPHPTGRGYQIVVDHGKPFATYYLHMESVRWGTIAQGAGGIHVQAGEALGVMGYDPTDPEGLRHLHFEVWYNGAGNSAIDPQAAPAPLGGVSHWQILDDPRWPQPGATTS